MTLSMSRVIRSSVGRPAVSIAPASTGRPFHEGARPGSAFRTWVFQPVGVTLVAVERGGGRRQLQDRLPEAVREGVDGRRLGVGQGHGLVSLLDRAGRGRAGCAADGASLPRRAARRPHGDLSKQGHLLRPVALAVGWRPRIGLQVGEVQRVPGEECAPLVGPDDVPGSRLEGRPEQRRSIELVLDEPARSGATTRNRIRSSLGGIRACRRRSVSPSIAVHSTSNRNATLPRTYQIASTSATSSTAGAIPPRESPLLAGFEEVAEEPAGREAPGLLLAGRSSGACRGAGRRRRSSLSRSVCSCARRATGPRSLTIRSGVLARLR